LVDGPTRSGGAVWSMSQRSEARGEMHRSGVEQRLGGEGEADSGPGLQRDEWGAGGGVERARSRAGWAARRE